MRLARIGVDNILGYGPAPYELLRSSTANVAQSSRITCFETKLMLENNSDLQVVDVRNESEISENGAIDKSIPIPLPQLHSSLNKLKADNTTIVYCASGYRSSIAASLLRSKGFTDVSELIGGFPAWKICKTSS
jgi:rhodanese-related sulfurtransferase